MELHASFERFDYFIALDGHGIIHVVIVKIHLIHLLL
jgi:hypothetical protein